MCTRTSPSNNFPPLTFQEFLSLAKKKQRKSPKAKASSDEASDSDGNEKKKTKQDIKSDSESEKDKEDEKTSEPEEGEVSDSSSSEEEFNDGYDDQLMGDDEDRARLAALTEKERETEIFKRIEQRELMKTRRVSFQITVFFLSNMWCYRLSFSVLDLNVEIFKHTRKENS